MRERHVFRRRGLIRIALLVMLISFVMTGAVWGAQWPKDVAVISPAPGASVHMVLVGVGKVVPKYTPIENWIVLGWSQTLVTHDERGEV
jgi:hypothetical protein